MGAAAAAAAVLRCPLMEEWEGFALLLWQEVSCFSTKTTTPTFHHAQPRIFSVQSSYRCVVRGASRAAPNLR